jgi:hypothetical protein
LLLWVVDLLAKADRLAGVDLLARQAFGSVVVGSVNVVSVDVLKG